MLCSSLTMCQPLLAHPVRQSRRNSSADLLNYQLEMDRNARMKISEHARRDANLQEELKTAIEETAIDQRGTAEHE